MAQEKVLLVYSGGLDTSICIPMMREEYGYKDVVTVTIDVGQDPADIRQAEEKAKLLKAEHYTLVAREEFRPASRRGCSPRAGRRCARTAIIKVIPCRLRSPAR